MEISPNPKKYHRIKNRLFLVGLALSVLILLALILSGFSTSLKIKLGPFAKDRILLNGLYAACIAIIFYLLEFPLDFYEGFILEHRFGLSCQGLGGYLKDNLKKAVISLIIFLVAIEFLYLFLERFACVWWLLAAIGWFILTVILAKITPSIFIPLFYKYIPLQDVDLKNKIMQMFSDTRIHLKDVYMIDFSKKTKKANAALAGFGANRRVVLTDNLLKDFSHQEILSIVAHELGHYKNRDTLKIISFGFVVSMVLFFLSDIILKKTFLFFGYSLISDIAGFPLFCLTMLILGLVSMPLQNGFTRRLETKADLYSISVCRNPEVFISMMEKLALVNLADVQPSKFIEIMLYDHPPIAKRIQLARNYGKER